MRTLLFAILCLSLAAFITAEQDGNDYVLGERKEGDYKITDRYIFKPNIPWKRMKVTIGVKTASSSSDVVNYVNITNLQENKVTYILVNGNIDTNSVVIICLGEAGNGLELRVQGYGIDPTAITTTEAPVETTKAETTVPVETTTEPNTSSEPTTTETTTTEPPPTETTPTEPSTTETTPTEPPTTEPTTPEPTTPEETTTTTETDSTIE